VLRCRCLCAFFRAFNRQIKCWEVINKYVDQPKKLAKHLEEPGKTLINHLINNNWFLVDLPGYGYAKYQKTKSFQRT
jgi:GTP-binding protein EngB required for normal cell division